MTDILTASESTALAEHEAVIERGIQTFYEVGIALADIRDRKLYRAEHGTFEDYCQQRWQMSKAHAYRMIAAAEVVSPIGDAGLPLPGNEGQARELGRVPEPERAEVWAETVERTDGKPTAAAVRETHEQRQQTDGDLLDGDDWVQPADAGFEAAVTRPPKPKRRPLPEAFTDAGRDLARVANRLQAITSDDRFPRNQQMVHGQMTELMIAIEHIARLIEAADLPSHKEEAPRHWWAERLNTIGTVLTDVARNLH